jgi:hypothetical protein
MELLRKYGVATTVYFPLVDFGATDFESTPVTFASGDTQISKDGGAFANTGSNPAHEGNGIYSLALTATEMQAGVVAVTVIDQTATKLWEDQAIVVATYGNASAEHAFDLDTATQDVNMAQISGSSTAADNLEASTLGIVSGAAQTGTLSTTQMTTDLTEATDDHYNGRAVIWTSGALAGQASAITDYTGSTKLLTFDAVTEAPANTDTFVIV